MLRTSISRGLVLLALGCSTVMAQPPAQLPPPPPGKDLDQGNINQEPLGGIVINRTITVLGWDFYSGFSSIWQSLHPNSPYTLTVVERPTAQFGSEIWIAYRSIRIYHTFLSPARSGVKEASKQAVSIATENIQKIEQARKEFKSDDLGPEEM
jgi:curli production assembly/transport component CsgE